MVVFYCKSYLLLLYFVSFFIKKFLCLINFDHYFCNDLFHFELFIAFYFYFGNIVICVLLTKYSYPHSQGWIHNKPLDLNHLKSPNLSSDFQEDFQFKLLMVNYLNNQTKIYHQWDNLGIFWVNFQDFYQILIEAIL